MVIQGPELINQMNGLPFILFILLPPDDGCLVPLNLGKIRGKAWQVYVAVPGKAACFGEKNVYDMTKTRYILLKGELLRTRCICPELTKLIKDKTFGCITLTLFRVKKHF